MTTKEKLLEEFDEQFLDNDGDLDKFNLDASDIKDFLSKAIDQTREETIKEVEEMLEEITPAYDGEALNTNNNRRYYEQGFGEYKEEIKQSLKSLINK